MRMERSLTGWYWKFQQIYIWFVFERKLEIALFFWSTNRSNVEAKPLDGAVLPSSVQSRKKKYKIQFGMFCEPIQSILMVLLFSEFRTTQKTPPSTFVCCKSHYAESNPALGIRGSEDFLQDYGKWSVWNASKASSSMLEWAGGKRSEELILMSFMAPFHLSYWYDAHYRTLTELCLCAFSWLRAVNQTSCPQKPEEKDSLVLYLKL